MAVARWIWLGVIVLILRSPLALAEDTATGVAAGAASTPAVAGSTSAQGPVPQPVAPNTVVLHRPVTVLGQDVQTADGKASGRIVDLLVTASGQPRAAVIDFGGFLGLGTRRVAVEWNHIHFNPGGTSPTTIDMTVDQLKEAPEYKDTKGPVAVANPPPPTDGATARPAAPVPTVSGPPSPTPSAGPSANP